MSSQEGGRGEEEPYTVTPITPHFGGEIRGFDLKGSEPLAPEVVSKIKEDMKRFRVLLFKDQGKISGERQVQISEQLGQVLSILPSSDDFSLMMGMIRGKGDGLGAQSEGAVSV